MQAQNEESLESKWTENLWLESTSSHSLSSSPSLVLISLAKGF